MDDTLDKILELLERLNPDKLPEVFAAVCSSAYATDMEKKCVNALTRDDEDVFDAFGEAFDDLESDK